MYILSISNSYMKAPYQEVEDIRSDSMNSGLKKLYYILNNQINLNDYMSFVLDKNVKIYNGNHIKDLAMAWKMKKNIHTICKYSETKVLFSREPILEKKIDCIHELMERVNIKEKTPEYRQIVQQIYDRKRIVDELKLQKELEREKQKRTQRKILKYVCFVLILIFLYNKYSMPVKENFLENRIENIQNTYQQCVVNSEQKKKYNKYIKQYEKQDIKTQYKKKIQLSITLKNYVKQLKEENRIVFHRKYIGICGKSDRLLYKDAEQLEEIKQFDKTLKKEIKQYNFVKAQTVLEEWEKYLKDVKALQKKIKEEQKEKNQNNLTSSNSEKKNIGNSLINKDSFFGKIVSGIWTGIKFIGALILFLVIVVVGFACFDWIRDNFGTFIGILFILWIISHFF